MPSVSESHPGIAVAIEDDQGAAGLTVIVAATYTAEPLEGPLRFWLDELGLAGRVEFAAYNQVFQELLDPTSAMGRNRGGLNVVLVRPEDWARFQPGGWDEATIRANAEELGRALRGFAERSGTPTIVAFPPPSPQVSADPARAAVLAAVAERLQADILPFDSLHWLGRAELGRYPVAQPHDEAGDRVGHLPYTNLATAALATAIARRINAIKSPPYKVIALDCDNTLWKGVVGEDGPHGITLGPGMRALQEFVVAQQAAGMVVCLVSKNVEADVLEAFDIRTDFPLRRDHLVAWRVSWEPKSTALVELAEELNLGLDSFIFLDDNPVECAEVRAALPQVLTIQVPGDEQLVDLLAHSWAFDRLKVTEEDRKRTRMYRVNAERTRLQAQSTDIGTFLASLELRVDIAPPTDAERARVAQLTQRTNQFNFSTRRRSEAEIRQLAAAGLECWRVNVADRFGDYGLVGVLIFGTDQDSLTIDTMLLSCRVLGRGVEHAMFARLGELARERGLAQVVARFVASAKNQPAANFLRSLPAPTTTTDPGAPAIVYRCPADAAARVVYRPGRDAGDQLELARTGGKPAGVVGPPPPRPKSLRHARIVAELSHPEAVLRAVEARAQSGRNLATPFVAPDTAIERQLAAIWGRVLHVDRVGVDDPFDDLGGTSLKAAQLFGAIEREFGVRLPMATLLDAPTVAELATRIAAAGRGAARESLRLLKPGAAGGPALFLVHDGDGEVLLYLNLARRLPDDLAVYGLEPHGHDHCPTVLTTIDAMAAYYVERIREIQPAGPYLLGGMCAGGTIAFEMARQLQSADGAVGLVALLDAADTQAELRPHSMVKLQWQRLRRVLRGAQAPTTPPAAPGSLPRATGQPGAPAPAASRGARLARKAATVAAKLWNGLAYEVRFRVEARRSTARVRHLQNLLARGSGFPPGYAGPSFRTVYKEAERAFKAAGTVDSPVLLIRAGADGLDHATDQPLNRIYQDALFGWGGRVAGGAGTIEAIDVPGGHGGMLQEPHVAAIAAPLRAAIDRVVLAEVGR